MERGLKAILDNQKRFPTLNSLYNSKNAVSNQSINRRQLLKSVAAVVGLSGAAMAAARLSSKKEEPISRREFLRRAGISTGKLFLGRFADDASTYKVINDLKETIEHTRNSADFKKLPPSVQEKLLPPAQNFEDNPFRQKNVGNLIEKPANIVVHPFVEALLLSSYLHSIALAAKSPGIVKIPVNVITWGSLGIAPINLFSGHAYQSVYSKEKIQEELRDLHAFLKTN